MDPQTLSRLNRAGRMDLVDFTRCAGDYDIPTIEAADFAPKDLVGFHYTAKTTNYNAGVHFFLDDYQFERVWREPVRYVQRLSCFACILTPDFSLFPDMPTAMKLYQVYRSRLLGQFYQDQGLLVIPTVSWAERASFRYCFDGLPKRAAVAISDMGVRTDAAALHLWHQGVDAMLERLEPVRILYYGHGQPIARDYGSAQVHHYQNHVTERMDRG